MASELKKVYGENCLNYINRYIGFATTRGAQDSDIRDSIYGFDIKASDAPEQAMLLNSGSHFRINNILYHVPHDVTKRIVGLVTEKYEDGGLRVAILGDETLQLDTQLPQYGILSHEISIRPYCTYQTQALGNVTKDDFDTSPIISNANVQNGKTLVNYRVNNGQLTYDEAIDYTPVYIKGTADYGAGNNCFSYQGSRGLQVYNTLTTNKNNTLVFGDYALEDIPFYNVFDGNPLRYLGGNLAYTAQYYSIGYSALCPAEFEDGNYFHAYEMPSPLIESYNGVCIPFNLILTEHESDAIAYINNGILPRDAHLYPLEWDNLPIYNPQTPGQDDDDDDGGNPDDDAKPSRDVDPTPVVAPSLLPTMFNANNMYWLNIGEFNNFLIWFWYDIQQFSVLDPTTWDNLIDNINGLYAELASAIIAVRYYPIDPDWVGGLGSQEVIKIAQVQKDGLVDTISKLNVPPIRNIGSYTVNKDFDSFLDLPPYSELTLYLPYYGYIQLDMDMFNGHSIDVKATYDILSGTITYYIFYDDTFMVNTYTAKLAVDVPITLQTSYDRDRAIQNNIATSLSGFMSAGAGMMSGNPIGMVMGISSLNTSVSPQNTAPIKVEGMTVEQGSLYLPSKCAVILRRPVTTKKGSSFAKNNGYLYCKTAKLSDLTGLTIVKNPRIRFNGAEYYNDSGQPTGKMLLPLESEIQEIYRLLEGGVII